MKIEFDQDKDVLNFEKHGISLNDADKVEWDTLWAFQDTRYDYNEVRMIGYAYIDLRLHCIVYTDRKDSRRVISLRKANKREIKRYAKA